MEGRHSSTGDGGRRDRKSSGHGRDPARGSARAPRGGARGSGGRASAAGSERAGGRGSRGGAGRQRTGKTSDGVREASPRPAQPGRGKVEKPILPDERPRLSRDVFRDLKSAAREGTVDEVCTAFGLAGEALARGDADESIRLLQWVKSVAARSAVVREALGVAHYMRGDFESARSELQTYRRISGRADQNHLLADCVRAQGRSEKVEELIEEMLASGMPAERAAEGVMVLAGDRADHGDVEGALSALDRVPLDTVPEGEPQVRRWYMSAGLHARLGDIDTERELLRRISDVMPGYLDVEERLA